MVSPFERPDYSGGHLGANGWIAGVPKGIIARYKSYLGDIPAQIKACNKAAFEPGMVTLWAFDNFSFGPLEFNDQRPNLAPSNPERVNASDR